MTQLVENRSVPRFLKEIVLGNHPWLDQLRTSAMARFDQVGFPNRNQEEWRHTWRNAHVDPLIKTHFVPAEPSHNAVAIEGAMKLSFGSESLTELVFVNGHFTP